MDWRCRSALLILVLVGCTSRGYPGPERPREEISTVTLSKVGEVNIEHINFDGHDISALSDNVDLLPGQHDFELHFMVEEQADCSSNETFCIPVQVRGICAGSLATLAGRTYLVTIENRYPVVDVRVSAKGYFDFSERGDEANPGAGSCREVSRSNYIW